MTPKQAPQDNSKELVRIKDDDSLTSTLPVETGRHAPTGFCYSDPDRYWRRQVADDHAHDLSLVIAKGVADQRAAGVSATDIEWAKRV